eukprot:5734588-Amphidinium_carterae.1
MQNKARHREQHEQRRRKEVIGNRRIITCNHMFQTNTEQQAMQNMSGQERTYDVCNHSCMRMNVIVTPSKVQGKRKTSSHA